jgi:uncharacterized protein YrrD
MLTSISRLNGSAVSAVDGPIGHVKEAYFDDHSWAVRYLVVDTGDWLAGRDVLVSPQSVGQPVGGEKNIEVTLTRAQVEASPNIDTHQPISRRHEREHLAYYAFPEYWGNDGVPLPPPPLPTRVETLAEVERRDAKVAAEDVHLRGSAEVTGYDIQASDDSIGHVDDFIVDDANWAVRYLVVDTRNWWPGGKKVLLATRWIDRIDWADRTVFTTLTREQVRNSPEVDPRQPIIRADEQRLHDAYGRETYWD